MNPRFNIAVIPGDGIGPEVIEQAEGALRRAAAVAGGFDLTLEWFDAGAGAYLRGGTALPEETLAGARAADAILLGACGLPNVRCPDGTEVVPQIELRSLLDLYAGIRPIHGLPAVPPTLAHWPPEALDFVVVRESTEGLFASRTGGVLLGDTVATDTQIVTRAGTERVVRAAFEWCRSRRDGARGRGEDGGTGRREALGTRQQSRDRQGAEIEHEHDSSLPSSPRSPVSPSSSRLSRVTCVDKANVFRSFAFFRRVFDEVAAEYRAEGIETDHCYVDAMALRMVQNPASLDVLVTENMFGDILSDLGAGLVGGLGLAPSADIGDRHALFQPVHGSAPDLAGRGIANPIAAILSAAMLLDWLGTKHSCPAARTAGARIEQTVHAILAAGVLPPDLGGSAGTAEVGAAVTRLIT